MRASTLVAFLSVVLAPVAPAAAQALGTFTLAFYLITPDGQAGHTTATLSPGTYSGPWNDDGGLSGTVRFGPGSSGGAPRPVSEFQHRVLGMCTGSEFMQKVRQDGSVECAAATGTGDGDITAVAAGTGLAGGGVSGDVTLGIATGGVGRTHIADGSIAAADIDVNQVQRRVLGTCTDGTYVAGINAAGTPTCSDGVSGNSVALGWTALSVNTRLANPGIGQAALAANTTGSSNTAVGTNALTSSTTGRWNIAVGNEALRSDSSRCMTKPRGSDNVALGTNALAFNITGTDGVAIGRHALHANTSGDHNVAVGSTALLANQTSSYGTAVGTGAMQNSTGSFNTAIGYHAADTLTTGFENTAIGNGALQDATTGARNIAIGSYAGGFVTTGSDNIHIGYQGAVNESDIIRVGITQTRAFISGIRGVTTGGANAVTVLIDSAGQLGTISSSRRTKEDIHDMREASAAI